MAKLSREERFNMTFESADETGGEATESTPPVEEEVVEEPESVTEEEETEPESDDEQEAEETEEAEDDDDVAEDEWSIKAREFASQTGLSRKELYNNVMFPTDRGEQSLSSVLDGYNGLAQEVKQLQSDRQHLQEKVKQAESPAALPQVSPEAQSMALQADLYENQLKSVDFTGMDAAQQANLRLDYRQRIDDLRTQAQTKQAEWVSEMQEKHRQMAREVHNETLSHIREWNDQAVYKTEVNDIGNFLRSRYGYTDAEIAPIFLSTKAVRLVRDAWAAMSEQADIKRRAKKIRKVSKTLSPGARRAQPKTTLTDVGRKVRKAGTRAEKQRARLNAEFSR